MIILTNHNEASAEWYSHNQSPWVLTWLTLPQPITDKELFLMSQNHTPCIKAYNNLDSNRAFFAVFTFLCLRKRWHPKFLLLLLFFSWWRMFLSRRTLKETKYLKQSNKILSQHFIEPLIYWMTFVIHKLAPILMKFETASFYVLTILITFLYIFVLLDTICKISHMLWREIIIPHIEGWAQD